MLDAITQIAQITGGDEHFDLAYKLIETMLASPQATQGRIYSANAARAHIAVQLNDVALAREQYTMLEAISESRHSGGISAHRLLGLLAHTIGNLDGGATHFEESIASCRKAGYRPELAWTCCDYADMLRERDGPGDQNKAATLLDEALAISTELGMKPLMERVLSRREILGA